MSINSGFFTASKIVGTSLINPPTSTTIQFRSFTIHANDVILAYVLTSHASDVILTYLAAYMQDAGETHSRECKPQSMTNAGLLLPPLLICIKTVHNLETTILSLCLSFKK